MPEAQSEDEPDRIGKQESLEENVISQDSEFDDDLGVPDSLGVSNEDDGDVNSVFDATAEEIPQDPQDPKLPFSSLHARREELKSQNREIFIAGERIAVRIIDNERSVATHPMNPNLYTIEFRHGPFTWCVRKRYKHVQNLHNQLKIFRASLKIPFPTRGHKERRNSLKNLGDRTTKRRKKGALPRFPNKPEILVSYEQLPQRMQLLEDYLANLVKIEIYKRHPETISFMEVSRLSFIGDLGSKGKEGLVLKRTGSGAKGGCNYLRFSRCWLGCNFFCTSICGTWNSRHLVVKDTFVAYIGPKDGEIKTVVLMDAGFEVTSGIYSTGLRDGLQISNLSRHIVLKCWTRRKAREWLEFIQNTANNEAKDFLRPNRHKSFAPCRQGVPAKWYVDGADYMAAVAGALENAREEIFIADWWLSPEIYLKRPVRDNDYWRLDKILQRKALEGVKVFVMIYKEVEIALGINSFYSKQRLVQGCPENIKILRHPDHARAGVLLWAHHEKIVVVDQSIAFVGGIDLCYGRWDNNEHQLTDLGPTHHSSIYIPSKEKITTSSTMSRKKGQDFAAGKHSLLPLAISTNTIALATTKFLPIPRNLMVNKKSAVLRSTSLGTGNRAGFSADQSVQGRKCNTPDCQRKNLFDLAKNAVDKVQQNVRIKRREWINMVYNPNELDPEDADDESSSDSDHQDEKSWTEKYSSSNFTNLTGAKLWLGKDYTNFIVKDFEDLERPYQDSVDRSTTPRMPWHDVGVQVQNSAARDIARHFIQRWNAIKMEKARLNPTYPFLLPKSYRSCGSDAPATDQSTNHRINCQVLRSVSSWSAGFLEPDTVEQSIHEAYIDAISNAKRYIYIENQFFISLATVERGPVKNRIGETLLKRIIRAHREASVFRVFVVMPLLPGFEGEIGGPTGTALHAITHWNYSSISRGRDAILNRLLEAGIKNPSDYISFHGLRAHSMLNGTMVTELIYVHSKLLIIDDNTVICGSANINDRSMIATRDSEIAVIIQDVDFTEGKMNGEEFPCGKFAGSLRKQLFREHLGLFGSKNRLNDPIADSFFRDTWRAASQRNTEIYEEVFRCIPSDNVKNFADLAVYQKETPLSQSEPDLARRKLANVTGHLVDLPLNFLAQETLTPAASTFEGILPTSLWT